MPADTPTRDGFSLRRWSRRKLDATRASEPAAPASFAVPPPTSGGSVPAPVSPAALPPEVAPPLPPVDSLTIDSDFTAFLQPQVDESVKRQALKKLFADPRFNVMDGLDTYIDDYTKSDPIPPDVLERLMRTFTFNPPVTPEDEAKRAAAESPSALAAQVPSAEPAQVKASELTRETDIEPTPASDPPGQSVDAVIRPVPADDARAAPLAPGVPRSSSER